MTTAQFISQRREFAAGLFTMLLGVICILAVGDLETGNSLEMGPGYVPRALAYFLVVAGLGMSVTGLRQSNIPLPAIHLRPLLVISAAVVAFGALIDQLGIVIAVIVSTAIASAASSISRKRETPLLCIALAAFAALAFVKGLGLSIPILPR